MVDVEEHVIARTPDSYAELDTRYWDSYGGVRYAGHRKLYCAMQEEMGPVRSKIQHYSRRTAEPSCFAKKTAVFLWGFFRFQGAGKLVETIVPTKIGKTFGKQR